MKIDDFKNVANLIRSTEVYNVYDYKGLKNLTTSLTELHYNQHTTGHSHSQEEVYVFLVGYGIIEFDGHKEGCKKGDVFTIPSGVFHKVYNTGKLDLKFYCVFENYR